MTSRQTCTGAVIRIPIAAVSRALQIALALVLTATVGAQVKPVEPPTPASAPVQQLLDQALAASNAGDPAKALGFGDQALAVARQTNDAPGEAHAQRSRALELMKLNRTVDAIDAWVKAEEAWQRIEDGPGQVEALGWQAVLTIQSDVSRATGLLQRAVAGALQETKRPRGLVQPLLEVGSAFADRSRFGESRETFETLKRLSEERFPGGLEYAASVNALGTVVYREGNLVTARQYFEQARKIRETLAPISLALASTFNNLGAVAFDQGDLRGAREHHQRALAIKEKLAPDSLTVAASLSNLSTVSRREGDLAGASDYIRRAATIYERLAPNSLLLANAYSNLGSVSLDRGDLSAAGQSYQQAFAIQQKIAPESLDVASSLNNLGVVALEQGSLPTARDHFERGRAIRERLMPKSLDLSVSLNNLGNVAMFEGRLSAARALHDQALAIRNALAPDSLDVADTLMNLGNDAILQGDLAAADAYYRQALTIREKTAPGTLGTANILENLGAAAYRRGDSETARTLAKKAMSIRESVAPNSLATAASLSNIGATAFSDGDLSAAEEYGRRAIALREALSTNSLVLAESLVNLGEIALARHDTNSSRDYNERALAIRERLAPNSLDVADSLRRLSEIALEEKDLARAVALGGRAWTIVESQGAVIAGDEARQAFQAHYQSIGRQLVRAQVALAKPDEAFATVEKSRAQALLGLLAERGVARQLAPKEVWVAYEVAQVQADRAGKRLERAGDAESKARIALDAEIAQQSASDVVYQKRRQLDDRTKETEQARDAYTQSRVDAERRWSDVLRSIESVLPQPIEPAEAKRSLSADTLTAEFVVGKNESTLLLIQRDGPVQVLVLELPEKELAARVDFVRRTVSREANTRGLRVDESDDVRVKAARDLYQKLFPPAAHSLIARASRIVILPDGALWDLPFAALVINADGKPQYLGIEKPITYAQSLTTLVRSTREARQVRSGTPRALIAGNPLYDETLRPRASGDTRRPAAVAGTRSNGELALLSRNGEVPAPLPFAGIEAREVASLYGTRAATGEEPTEAWFRKHARDADVIHLATHGYFNPFRAVSSGVRLAVAETVPGANDTDNDGALQAWEVFTQLQLQAEVVVLSACQTGVGSRVPGEGLVGLTRAFQVAGARSVVATQWNVPDRSTATAMVSFHQSLRKGLAKDLALQQSMRRVADDPATRHPYYWAPFVLIGDSRPLR